MEEEEQSVISQCSYSASSKDDDTKTNKSKSWKEQMLTNDLSSKEWRRSRQALICGNKHLILFWHVASNWFGGGGTNEVYSIENLIKKDTCGCLYEQDIEKAFYFS